MGLWLRGLRLVARVYGAGDGRGEALRGELGEAMLEGEVRVDARLRGGHLEGLRSEQS